MLYAASTFFSSVNIGYRHLLPLLPFLFIFISRLTLDVSRFTHHVLRITHYALRFTFYALLICYLAVTLRLSPHYLAYFNVRGGQAIATWWTRISTGGRTCGICAIGWRRTGSSASTTPTTARPAPQVYGIQADFLPPDPRAVGFAPLDPAPGVYAIGATVLQGVYTPDVNTYAWFRAREPVARLGHALFVYEVPERPAPAWAALCADPSPPLSPEEVRARFGNPDLRVILLDCGQSWIYPAGENPGGYVLPPGAEPPPGATLEVAARHPDGSPFYDVYRVESKWPTPERPVANVTLDGPLAFLGYQVDMTGAHPGAVIELQTLWKVNEIPSRPLSLMAHLVGMDGDAVAVGDGLGVPIETMAAGRRDRTASPAPGARRNTGGRIPPPDGSLLAGHDGAVVGADGGRRSERPDRIDDGGGVRVGRNGIPAYGVSLPKHENCMIIPTVLKNKKTRGILQLLLSLALLVWLVGRVGLDEIVSVLTGIDWAWYLPAFLLFCSTCSCAPIGGTFSSAR